MARQSREHREHERVELACPIKLYDNGGEVLAQSKTLNISDGGALVSLPLDSLPKIGSKANITLSVPRSTPTTYMLEDFACRGEVIRHQPLVESNFAGLALRFEEPQELGLVV